MEQLCYFVNSRGILKSCTFHSPNPKSSCNYDKNYLYFMLSDMFDGMSVYVCSDLLKFFVNGILPKINKRFVLVSGDSDLCVPKEILNENETIKLLNSPYLIRWFLQNTQIQNCDKMTQMPIGLDYHTISNDPSHDLKTENESHLPIHQELILMDVISKSKPLSERINKIYVNFSLTSDRFNDRKSSLDSINPDLLEINNSFTKRTTNWQITTNYAFVLSPFGIGMDCHRTWESICLGSVPIVKAPNFKNLFKDLPVLIVNEWSDITQELLDNTIQDFKTKTFNYDKLKLSYWITKINNNFN